MQASDVMAELIAEILLTKLTAVSSICKVIPNRYALQDPLLEFKIDVF